MAMTFRQLRYFVVLAEELHFGRAARRLHISQPPLSASLRQLEEELGVQLLDRTSKRVALTRPGEVFYRQARRLLGQLSDTRALIKRVADSASGVVRVGFTPAMIFRDLPKVVADFQRLHPGIDVQLVEKNSVDQVEALSLDRIDIGFIHSIPLPETIASLVIADEEFVCCLPVQHPLSTRGSVSLHELVGEPLVMFNRALAPYYYDRIIGLFQVAGVEPTVRHEVSHWLTIIALIAQGVGMSLVPKSLANTGFARVAFLPLEDADARHESRCIWLADTDDMRRDLLLDCVRSRFQKS